MIEQPTRPRRKGSIAWVGELLIDGHANCLEELGALVIADSRINEFFAGLKQGKASVKAGTSSKQLDDEYREVYETLVRDFERVKTEFLTAEWPKARPDVWQAHQEKLRQAVTALTERVTRLLAEYVP